jgi:hypothetical protein
MTRLGSTASVFLDELLDLLLAAEQIDVVGGIEAEPDGVAVAQELADALLAAEFDVFALVILEEEFESHLTLVEVESQVGFGEVAGGGWPDSSCWILSAR